MTLANIFINWTTLGEGGGGQNSRYKTWYLLWHWTPCLSIEWLWRKGGVKIRGTRPDTWYWQPFFDPDMILTIISFNSMNDFGSNKKWKWMNEVEPYNDLLWTISVSIFSNICHSKWGFHTNNIELWLDAFGWLFQKSQPIWVRRSLWKRYLNNKQNVGRRMSRWERGSSISKVLSQVTNLIFFNVFQFDVFSADFLFVFLIIWSRSCGTICPFEGLAGRNPLPQACHLGLW